MSEYAKHIQTIEDMWKKRIELREEGGERMSGITNERTKTAIDDWMAVKDGKKSRWHELFGTPERAARTLVERLDVGVLEWCNNDCDNCPYEYNPYGCEQDLTLLEWLRGDA